MSAEVANGTINGVPVISVTLTVPINSTTHSQKTEKNHATLPKNTADVSVDGGRVATQKVPVYTTVQNVTVVSTVCRETVAVCCGGRVFFRTTRF